MPDAQIFKATYSGVPVYEMMFKGVAVMRRRADSWLNATQILKVAGFDKPQRTRILEREVQKGEHEKVQGGYGKYQGTWIPLERGLHLAKQYNCEVSLRPIIEFQPASKSPPPAPKHVVASSANKANARKAGQNNTAAAQPTRVSRRVQQKARSVESDPPSPSEDASDDSMTPSPSEASSSSRTPSPIMPNLYNSNGRGRANHRLAPSGFLNDSSDDESRLHDPRTYGDQILEYFISDTNQIPDILVNPPADFDANMAIDDDGHTSLHWACAMGRIKTVKLLLSAGADIFKVNKSGQTPLMRSVMFANNYDVRKFPELYELLHKSTLNIDNYNRTVFHHVVDVAMSKGKTHAARYYMENILNRLSDYPKELADVINFQDEDGETSLTMAARCRSKRLVKLLIDYGADPKIVNNDGKSTEDYILEDERFRLSPIGGSRRQNGLLNPIPTIPAAINAIPTKLHLHHSTAGQKASTRAVSDMASMLESLATSFDGDLREKDRDYNQAQALLTNIQQDILETSAVVRQLKAQAEGLAPSQQQMQDLRLQLSDRTIVRSQLGWERWLEQEEQREARIRQSGGGSLQLTPATASIPVDDDVPMDGTSQDVYPMTYDEDISDMHALFEDTPSDPALIQAECDMLREELQRMQEAHLEDVEQFVSVHGDMASDMEKMQKYHTLISAATGGLPSEEVNDNLQLLLETLESEEPSASVLSFGNGVKA
ncbi:transcription factor [Flagelloscypha sp. PMI_526]|nr:transcription factor [Flagelloscypha sp. PMI_526]